MLTRSVFLLGTALLCVSLSQAKAPLVEDHESGFFHKAMSAVREFAKGMELFPDYSSVTEGVRIKKAESAKELFERAHLSAGQPAKNFAPKAQAQEGIDPNSEQLLEELYPSLKQAGKEAHHTQEIEAEMKTHSTASPKNFKQTEKAQAELDRESNIYSSISVQTSEARGEVLPPIQPVLAADQYRYSTIISVG
jgi:hypothetical protein